jgi:hypothetical protein
MVDPKPLATPVSAAFDWSSFHRWNPLETAREWRALARIWRAPGAAIVSPPMPPPSPPQEPNHVWVTRGAFDAMLESGALDPAWLVEWVSRRRTPDDTPILSTRLPARVIQQFRDEWLAGLRLSLAIRRRTTGEAVGAVELRPVEDAVRGQHGAASRDLPRLARLRADTGVGSMRAHAPAPPAVVSGRFASPRLRVEPVFGG